MTNYEQIPNDFDVAGLLEPTPETLNQFSDTCLQLDSIGELDHPEVDPDTGETPDFYTVQSVRQPFNNGTTISHFSFHGSDELTAEWAEMGPLRNITLKTAQGNQYEYSADVDGNTKLFIKKPGERVRREVDGTSPVVTELDNGLSVGFKATPEIMKEVLASIAERREADELGLSKPTEASLREFNAAIRDALASGVTPSEGS